MDTSNGCDQPQTPETKTAHLITDEAEKDIVIGLGIDLKETMRAAEVSLVRAALGQAKGNISAAARLLRLNRTTLHEKMRRYAIG